MWVLRVIIKCITKTTIDQNNQSKLTKLKYCICNVIPIPNLINKRKHKTKLWVFTVFLKKILSWKIKHLWLTYKVRTNYNLITEKRKLLFFNFFRKFQTKNIIFDFIIIKQFYEYSMIMKLSYIRFIIIKSKLLYIIIWNFVNKSKNKLSIPFNSIIIICFIFLFIQKKMIKTPTESGISIFVLLVINKNATRQLKLI